MTSISGSSSSSTAMMQMLQQMFQKTDVDKSGGINLEELTAVAPAKGLQGGNAPDATAIFEGMDSDASGSVSKEEFTTAFQQIENGMKSTLLGAQEQSQTQSIEDIFAAADENNDGTLTKDEFAAAAPQGPPPGGPPPTDETSDASAIFDSLDTNEDGTVSVDELAAALDEATEANSSNFLLSLQEQSSDDQNSTQQLASKLYDMIKTATQQSQTSSFAVA